MATQSKGRNKFKDESFGDDDDAGSPAVYTMSDTVIRVENVSKLYRLGEVGTGTLSHDLNRWWHRVRGKEDPYLKIGQTNDRTKKGDSDYAWALKDVSFEVKRGEVLGIIGRNGAGKSTLLKILSRVTTPTEGQIKIKGRVASLLEVGTGFNPELTGRDNIYLNGAILGMRKWEIDRKFDEIVAFAEVERYIDTPVKRYSSGMYVRLAFGVAAHLEPEILIVDEVLAVGDAHFQNKCLKKIQSISKAGKTVLFVSHNISTVKTLCESGALLENGRMVLKGPASMVVDRYIASNSESTGIWVRSSEAKGSKEISFVKAFLSDSEGRITTDFDMTSKINLNIEALSQKKYENIQFAIRVTNQDGIPIFTTCNTDLEKRFLPLEPGLTRYSLIIDCNLLAPGKYTLKIAVHLPKAILYDLIDDVLSFEIHDTGSLEKILKDDRLGVLNLVIPWKKH